MDATEKGKKKKVNIFLFDMNYWLIYLMFVGVFLSILFWLILFIMKWFVMFLFVLLSLLH